MKKPDIHGVTPNHCLPTCAPCVFMQMCETDKLVIQNNDPDIDEVVKVQLTITVRNFKVLCTPIGRKLIIFANKEIELITKKDCITYVSKYYIPFCAFIMLEDIDDGVHDVKAVIEAIDVSQINNRCVALSAFILLYPEFTTIHDIQECDNSICCNIALNDYSPIHRKHITSK